MPYANDTLCRVVQYFLNNTAVLLTTALKNK